MIFNNSLHFTPTLNYIPNMNSHSFLFISFDINETFLKEARWQRCRRRKRLRNSRTHNSNNKCLLNFATQSPTKQNKNLFFNLNLQQINTHIHDMHNFSRNKQTEQIQAHAFIVYTFFTFIKCFMFSFIMVSDCLFYLS